MTPAGKFLSLFRSRVLRLHSVKVLFAGMLCTAAIAAQAQARATASRFAEAQAGGSFINGNSDYSRSRFNGYGFYADLDFHHGIGAEAEFRYMGDGDPNTHVYQRTYQIGARYSRHYGRFQPFAKILVGRGVQNYPYNIVNLASNMGSIGGGLDYHITRRFNARVDYEYQHWFSFSRTGTPNTNNDSLTPSILSAGFAYHF